MLFKKRSVSNVDLQFMSNLGAATIQKSVNSTRIILWLFFSITMFGLVWAYFSEVDEVTRGEGKVITPSHTQVVQNLEGGIVTELLAREGKTVKRGDILLKIDDLKHVSDYDEAMIKYEELSAKALRLKKESSDLSAKTCCTSISTNDYFLIQEESMFKLNRQKLINDINILNEQRNQKIFELDEYTIKLSLLQKSHQFISSEMAMMKKTLNTGVSSLTDYLKLQREANEQEIQIESIKKMIPKTESAIEELQSKVFSVKIEFQNKAKDELTKLNAEIGRVKTSLIPLQDQVKRTMVISPVDGIVKRLFINTIGGVIKPGMDIAEIVPNDENLYIEAKIKPSDIAFMFPGQKCKVKFTAYDFSIYGGLEGEVVNISADTITEEKKDESFYLVKIQTYGKLKDKKGKEMDIIPGMTVSVDILTGKKTILDYLMKPILKSKEQALTER